jgi:hypothetical protein
MKSLSAVTLTGLWRFYKKSVEHSIRFVEMSHFPFFKEPVFLPGFIHTPTFSFFFYLLEVYISGGCRSQIRSSKYVAYGISFCKEEREFAGRPPLKERGLFVQPPEWSVEVICHNCLTAPGSMVVPPPAVSWRHLTAHPTRSCPGSWRNP